MSKREVNSPANLVKTLTKDKASEREKFQAIFDWVTGNIRYNYRTYYSSGGVGRTNINEMLKKRMGICLDYSNLMDTLCSLAGITNVSIYGYAKDHIFDVNDSLYIDNHSWNAVRLNGQWHLYDATWSSGFVKYEYTRFSKLLLKMFEGVKSKYKKKKLKGSNLLPEINCENEPVYYYKQRLGNILMLFFLNRFHIKIHEVYVKKANEKFLFIDPDIFSITHFPDNPVWALTNKTFRAFEMDSAYYYLNDKIYEQKKYTGTACTKCDSILLLSKTDKLQTLKKSSLESNSRNRFITALCEYHIAREYRQLSKRRQFGEKKDLLDSSYAYLINAGKSLKQCGKNIQVDFRLQKKKNQHKLEILYRENKIHKAFLKSKVKQILKESRANRGISNKTRAGAVKSIKRIDNISTLKTNIPLSARRRKNPEKISALSKAYDLCLLELDSLTNEIENHRIKLDVISSNVVLNIWQKATHYDSLIEPFKRGMRYRTLLKDNYKKEVVDIRKQIPIYERDYAQDLENILLTPSQTGVEIGNIFLKLMDKRYNLERQIFKISSELVRYGELSEDALVSLKTRMDKENRKEYCWMESKTKIVTSIYMGFDFLNLQQKKIEVAINYENDKERIRLYTVDKELRRRRNKYKNIVSNNISVMNRQKKEILKIKRTKELRKN